MAESVISLFSGAGGMSLGFRNAGLKPRVGFDNNTDATKTYSMSLGSECHTADLTGGFPAIRGNVAGIGRPFAVIGGPPCQGFSSAGLKYADDPRNALVFSHLDIVRNLRPKWFLMENVEGMVTSGGGDALASLLIEFTNLGYTLRVAKVNLATLGLPQARKRLIIVGNSCGLPFSFPSSSNSCPGRKHAVHNGMPPCPGVGEALAGLGAPVGSKEGAAAYSSESPLSPYDASMRGAAGSVSLHYSGVSKLDRERCRHLKPGETMRDLPPSLWPASYARRANRRVSDGTPSESRGGAPIGMKRLEADLPCLTVTGAAVREFVHPTEDRFLTIREAARIQSFPDWYEFSGSSASAIRQVANAFPALAAEAFAKMMMEADGKAGTGARSVTPGLLDASVCDAKVMSPKLAEAARKLKIVPLSIEN